MIVQIFDKYVLEILTVFSMSPGSKFLRKELKERTKLNNVNLDNAINVLLSSGLIKKEKRLLSLNLENARQVTKLIGDEYKKLNELPLDAYFSVVNLVLFLGRLKDIDAYLFGSYAKLIFKETSDIDIAIVSDEMRSESKRELSRLIQKLESRYGRKIEIHYFGKSFYRNKKDPLVKDILRNGLKLI